MKIGSLIFISQMNRDTFNALKRRGHFAFLDKHPTGEDSDRYGPWHALGVAAFCYLRRLGVEAGAASEAVSDSWPDIIRIAGMVDESPRTELCGIRINDLNVTDTFGWHHPRSKGGEPVASVSVNLRVLWEWIQPLLVMTTRPSFNDGATEA